MRGRDEATIWAPATARGRAGAAILRISGPAARGALERLTGQPPPPARRLSLRSIRDPGTGELLDRGLAVLFSAPASFTGEDVVELHHHGGPAILAALARALRAVPGLRPAEPGEFTRRAFLHGRLDLTAAEGLADLVAAETESQRRQALRQLEGALGRRIAVWRETLVRTLALVEAEIDFAPEEGDVPDRLLDRERTALLDLHGEMLNALDEAAAGERLRDGVVVAVIGPPNAGKSSLVNGLARREVAIVTEIPGTTRDVLEVQLDLGGVPVALLDTAGLRESPDLIEREGVARARSRAATADLRLLLLDAAMADAGAGSGELAIDLVVWNKIDLLPATGSPGVPDGVLGISCRTGEGLTELEATLTERAAALVAGSGQAAFTRERHRGALAEAVAALGRLLEAPAGTELALRAEDLRLALRALGRITGEVRLEELLDRIFSEFCIGK